MLGRHTVIIGRSLVRGLMKVCFVYFSGIFRVKRMTELKTSLDLSTEFLNKTFELNEVIFGKRLTSRIE